MRLLIDGAEVHIRRTQVRRALALLAAHSGQPVTQDQLVEHLWADRLPTDPRASLRVALSRLRETLGQHQGIVSSTPVGYVIDVATDARDFERAITAAEGVNDPQEQARLLEQGLAHWRSDTPCEDLLDAPMLEAFLSRLLHLKLTATIRNVEVLDHLGRHDEAVALGLAVTPNQPGDERLAMALAHSLAALGRKAAAIELLNTTRSYLRDELGLSPCPELLAVEDAILRDGVQLDRPRVPSMMSTASRTFVGRDHELTVLAHALLRGTDPGFYVIVGEAGAGKSALLREALRRLESTDRTVISAQGTQTPTRPMEPLGALLAHIARTVPVARHDNGLRSALARLAPEHVDDDVAPPASRDSLLTLARESLESFVTSTGAIIVIEDAQWLDRSTAQVIRDLVEGGECTVVATAREKVPGHVEFMHDVAAAAIRVLRLSPLTRDNIETFVTAELSSLPHEQTVTRLVDQSGGNPLFLSLLADILAEGSLDGGALPPNVLLSVQQRIASMSLEGQKTLQHASIFKGPFALEVLRELRPTAEPDIADAIAEGLIEEATDSDRFCFAHALVAEATYQLLSDGARVDLHDEVGRLLEESGAPPAEYAMHCSEAATVDPQRATWAHLHAARAFAQGFAWDTALFHAERALSLHQQFQLTDAVAHAELLVLSGSGLRAQGLPEGDEPLIAGLIMAAEHDATDVVVSAIVALSTHGRMRTAHGPPIYAVLEKTLTNAALTPAQRIRLLAAGSTLVAVSPLQQRGREMFREALEGLDTVEDLGTTRHVLLQTHLGCPHPDDRAMRHLATQKLADIAESDPDLLWEVAYLQYGEAMVENDLGAAHRCLARMQELAPRTRMRNREFGVRFSEAAWARLNNDLDGAEAALDEAMAIGTESFDEEWRFMVWAGTIGSIREAQGRMHDLLAPINEWIDADPTWPTWHAAAAAAAASCGDRTRTRAELDWLMQDNFDCLCPDVSWSAMLSFLTAPVVLLNDVDAATMLLALVEPYAGLNLWNGACVHRPADEVIEALRAVAGA